MEKPYLKKLQTIEDFEIWEVDGKYIRDNIDREFTNFGQHFRFPFIPTHQFWIDKEHGDKETKYFVDHMITEWNLMHDGKSYGYACGEGDKKELNERKKSEYLKKALKNFHHNPKNVIPQKLYKQKIAENAGVVVWIVDGELVRDLYYVEYTEGGHHFVYDFVPYNEVWLDDDLDPQERDFVLLHELHERYLMHSGLNYEHAHHSSSIIEYKCRRDSSKLKECLEAEIAKNAQVVK